MAWRPRRARVAVRGLLCYCRRVRRLSLKGRRMLDLHSWISVRNQSSCGCRAQRWLLSAIRQDPVRFTTLNVTLLLLLGLLAQPPRRQPVPSQVRRPAPWCVHQPLRRATCPTTGGASRSPLRSKSEERRGPLSGFASGCRPARLPCCSPLPHQAGCQDVCRWKRTRRARPHPSAPPSSTSERGRS